MYGIVGLMGRRAGLGVSLLAVTVGLAGCAPAEVAEAEAPELLLVDGRVYTLDWPEPAPDGTPDPAAPHTREGWEPDAEGLAIADGRITAVGSGEEIRELAGPDTRVVELAGATVIPGLVESHVHAAELGRNLRRLDLSGVESPAAAVRLVEKRAGEVGSGEWILGWGFDDGAWADAYPDNEALSEATPDHPVLLRGLHGFAVWADDQALAAAGIDESTPDPSGGRILRRPDGTPTGILLDRAAALLDGVGPQDTAESTAANLLAGLRELARSGYVAVHEAGVDDSLLQAMLRLDAEGELPVRVYAMLSAREPGLLREWQERGPRFRGFGIPGESVEPRVVVRSVKAYYDGALGSRGARLLEDYADMPGHRGTAGVEYGFDEELVAAMMREGFQVGIHAIGDAANRATLDFIERVQTRWPETRDGRHRIEHAQVLHPEDLPRLAALGVTASMEPPHAVEDMAWAEERIGAERLRGAYAWRLLRLAGTRLLFNSDLPGSDHSIFYGLHAAVTRRDRSRNPEGGWYPGQALTPEESLRAYTVNGAWAAFQEDRSGTLAPGKWADVTVLRPDPLRLPDGRYGEILDGEILLTLVGGEVAYEGG